MEANSRLREIRRLLETALDNDEEYLYEGEMSVYTRTYAGDAATDLRTLFERGAPTPTEIDICVAALAEPQRLANGRSKWMLSWLRDQSRPLLIALAKASDVHLRLFALEAASHNISQAYGYRPQHLCQLIAAVPALLDDADDEVRAAAVASSTWMWSNTNFIEHRAQEQSQHIVIQLYRKIVSMLDDPSAKVRAATATALGDWAASLARDALMARLAREDAPSVRDALSKALEN